MTRKKSRVKALALAVTCAILAGGYFCSTPVYASQLKTGFDIEQIEGTVNGTTISSGNLTGTITISGDAIAGALEGTDLSNARVRVTGTTTSTISLGTLYDHAAEARDTANAVKAKTKGITYDDTEESTTVGGVKFSGGNVTDVKNLKVADYVEVGNIDSGNWAKISTDGLFIGSDPASNKIKAKINVDGSIEAAEGNFTVDKDGKITVANGKFEVDNVGRLTAAGGNFKVYNDGGVDATTIAATGTISAGTGTDFVVMDSDGTLTATKSVKADKIEEFVDGNGVYVDGVRLKDGTVTAADGSTIGGVKFSSGNITNAESMIVKNYVKAGNYLQVGDNTKGLLYVRPEGIYIGADKGYSDQTKTEILADGTIKAAGGKVKITNDSGGNVAGLQVIDKKGNYAYVSENGTVTASNGMYANSIYENTFGEGVTVDGVLLKDGGVSTSALYDKASGEGISVADLIAGAGNTAGIKRSALASGSHATTIEGKVEITSDGEVTINKDQENQVKIDSNGIKVGLGSAYINNDGFKAGADGKNSLTTSGLTAKTINAGANNTEFTVDEDGNTTVAGKLNVTGDTTLAKLDVTGDATVGGKLDVTGDATFGGNIKGKSLKIGTSGTEFTVDEDGALSAAGGKVTIDKNGNATFGDTGSNITRIEGNKFTTGYITTDANMESSIGGVTMKNGKITAGDLSITGTLDMNNLKVNETLTVGGFVVDKTGKVTGVSSLNGATVASSGTGLKIGTATIGDTNPFSSNGYTVDANGNISAGTYNGNTIGTDKKFNGVTLDSGEVEAKKLTAGTITDGNGFTAAGGNVAAKDIKAETGTIAGIAFKNNNISDVNNITASGTVKAATLKVNDNNVLDSNGLKADKAVIDNLTIDGESITSNNADGSVGIAGITVDKNGAMSGVNAIDGVKVSGGSTAGGLTIGDGATAVTIGGNSLALSSNGFSVDNDGDIVGKSFTAGNSYLKDGELKLNDANIWTTAEGLKAEKATIGANSFDDDGLYTKGTLGVEGKASFGKDAANRTTIEQGTVNVTQNGTTTTISGGEITTDKLTVNDIVLKKSMTDGSGNTIEISGTDGSLKVAGGRFKVDEFGQVTNEYTTTDGEGHHIKTSFKTSQDGINADYSNASNGNHNLLSINKNGVSLGVTGAANQKLGGFAANEDNASLSYGDDNSVVVDGTTIKSALGSEVSTTLTNDGADQSIVSKVGTAKRTLKKDEIIDEVAGMTVKTDSEGTLFTDGVTSTLIKGSRITSTNGSSTGILDGSNLTLSDGTNKTEMSAGGVSYTGEAGEHSGTTTTIKGGTITTDTLNVERINLGGELYDKNGTAIGGNLSMDKDGNFSAAGGNFEIVGGSGANRGAMTNVVGNTTVKTDVDGASMGYDNGSVKSNVSVGDNNANMSSGNASVDVKDGSITSKVGDSASSTIKGDSITDKVGSTTVETKDGSFSVKGDTNKGMDIDTSTGKTTFTGSKYKDDSTGTTTIDGDTITTGKLVTDQLVIKGNGSGDTSGDGGESGSIAFGGDGTITSNIKDGDNETTFKTEADGVSSEVTNGKYTSNVDQSADRIGSVITGGNVRIGSVADGTLGVLQNGAGTVDTATGETLTEASQAFSKDGTITSVAKDADGNSSKLVQDGKGLEYTDSANTDNATRINSSDVSIGSATDDSKRINLSDLGQIDDLDSELTSRDEFTSNKTAVGGINAEAAVRREEVARLDNRIDDVNDRVDKVGAMAAAIASLKSIGYDPQAPSEFSVGLGQYKGETGVALGFFHYPNKNFMVNVSLSTAGGETMGGIGATWRFGHKSPQKLLDEQREAQAKKELAAAEKYQAAAQLAKEAQERAEYAAKLARQAQVSADNAKAAADATQAKHFNK